MDVNKCLFTCAFSMKPLTPYRNYKFPTHQSGSAADQDERIAEEVSHIKLTDDSKSVIEKGVKEMAGLSKALENLGTAADDISRPPEVAPQLDWNFYTQFALRNKRIDSQA